MTTFLPEDFDVHSGQRKSGAYLLAAVETATHVVLADRRTRFQPIPSKGLDALGITQRKLNNNFNSWMDDLSDQDKREGELWYPTGHDWGHHMSDLHDQHPDKVFGAMSKMSPQRDWYANLDDAHNVVSNHRGNPGGIVKPGGLSGTDNLKQSLRVMGAEDHPDAIHAAFLGTKNVGGRPVPRTPKDLPKTHDFWQALRDPETGGAFNHAEQPAVADSWMSRSGLWSKKAWEEANNGGKPLSWPGQGTGQGLDKHLLVKKPNPETGVWEAVGTKPPTARDVAARVTGMGGGYGRMRQMMQQGAARHGMPFSHGAQAAVWKSISENKNPNDPEFDHSKVGPSGALWNQMWNQRASGLHVPQQQGFQVARIAAHGSAFDLHGPEDSLDEGWGTAEDISHILRHIAQAPSGWDHWEGRPGMVSLGPTSPLESHEQQRMGPHPGQIEASAWYTAGSGKAPWNNRPNPAHRPQSKPSKDLSRFAPNLEQGEEPDEDAQSEFDLTASRWYTSSWYVDAASDGLDESSDELKKGRGTGTTSTNPGSSQSAGAAGNITPGGLNKTDGSSGGALPTYRIPSGGEGSAMPGSAMPSGGSGGPPVPFTPSQGVQQWKNQVDLGLQRNGLPVSLENQVLHQMETESSGNPNAINRTDSNAQAGHPSQGLLQTIPSTFQEHHYQGDSDSITDPQANIDSAIGYAKGRYGPTLMNNGQGMGSGHGY